MLQALNLNTQEQVTMLFTKLIDAVFKNLLEKCENFNSIP